MRPSPRVPNPLKPPYTRTVLLLAAGGYALFAAITALVHVRALAALDITAMEVKEAFTNQVFDAFGAVTGVLVSAEASLAYALVVSFLLWRTGLGIWSLAPFAFVPPVALELVLKLVIDQPQVPADFHTRIPYPLTHVPTPGAFPSGHALRTGFFSTFLAVLLYVRSNGEGKAQVVLPLVLALLIAYSRTYVGDHWLSDVVAGLAIGAATALLAAWPVAVWLHREPGTKARK